MFPYSQQVQRNAEGMEGQNDGQTDGVKEEKAGGMEGGMQKDGRTE